MFARATAWIKKVFRPGGFAANVATLSVGTVLAQTITIAAAPFLTRLYAPAEMGTLAAFVATTSVLGLVATGRYDLAVVLPERETDAGAVALLGVAIACGVGGVVSVLAASFRVPVAVLLGLASLPRPWFGLIGVVVILNGTEYVLTRLHIREERYRSLAFSQVGQQLGANGVKMVGGLVGAGTNGLLAGTLVGYVVRTAYLAYNQRNRLLRGNRSATVNRLWEMAKRYRKFPLLSTWSAFLNSASLHVPVILLAALFSPAVAGYYALTDRILKLPMTLVGQSVMYAFVQRSAALRTDPEELKRLTLSLYARLLLVGAVVLSFVTFYGGALFPFVFGAQWAEAGKYAQWVSTWLVLQLASAPLSGLYDVLERQGEVLAFQLSLFGLRLASIVVGAVVFDDPMWAIVFFCLVSILMYGVLSVRLLRLVGVGYSQIAYRTMLGLAGPFLCQSVVWFIATQTTRLLR